MSRVVYQSTNAKVIETIEANEAARIAWGDTVRELGKEAFGGEGNFYSYGHDEFAAFVPHGTMPEGWRLDKRSGGWVPYQRTAEGKQWARRLSPLKHKPADVDPGGQAAPFVDSSDGGIYFRRPNYVVVGGIAYCVWGGKPPGDHIDGRKWKPCRYSEFLRVCEDNELMVA